MEQITSMKITGLTLTNFRNHTETEHFDFGDLSYITGHNGTGKTTMAHAVCYALYGVSYYGEQKIERLMNEKADNVQVRLDFIDQDGKAHCLVRSRNGDKGSMTYDGYTINQSGVEQLFGDKNTFIAMFNPTYLVENMGNDGRDLILRQLRSVSQQEILAAMPSFSGALEGLDLEKTSPEQMLKDVRTEIRRAEQQAGILEGQIQSITEAQQTAKQKLSQLRSEKETTEARIAELKAKQFEGLNTEEFGIQRDVLTRKLSAGAKENPAATALRGKLAEAKARVYTSKYAQAIGEAQAEYRSLGKQYTAISQRIQNLKVGDVCPTCLMPVTAENIEQYRKQLMAEAQRLGQLAQGVVERGKELTALDAKAKSTFEQFQADDIAKFTAELQELQGKQEQADPDDIRAQLEKLAELEKYGNLTEQEFDDLQALKATLIGIDAQISAIEEAASTKRLEEALVEQDIFEQHKKKLQEIVTSLTEYIFKRTELATQELNMPNVKIRLFDVVRSTGEVKSAFKFDYKDREYTTLSLSEKTLAGIEICAMLRRITGKDYPICIDNTESIAAFNDVEMPSQVWLLRVVKGQALTVQFQNKTQTYDVRKAA